MSHPSEWPGSATRNPSRARVLEYHQQVQQDGEDQDREGDKELGSENTYDQDLSLVDWSIFEPGTYGVYRDMGSAWISGRAVWKGAEGVQPPMEMRYRELGLNGEQEEDISIKHQREGNILEKANTEFGYFGQEDGSTPIVPSPTQTSPQPPAPLLHTPIIPLPTRPLESPLAGLAIQAHGQREPELVIPCLYFISLARDKLSQLRLRAALESSDAMYHAGLPVLPTAATWVDRFGNFMLIKLVPSSQMVTLREMYIEPGGDGDGKDKGNMKKEAAFSLRSKKEMGAKSVKELLSEVIQRFLSIVSAVEVRFFHYPLQPPLTKKNLSRQCTKPASFSAASASTPSSSPPQRPSTPSS